MIIKNRKICEIKLTPEELNTLANARDILEKIVDVATEEDVMGFKVAHTVYELSTCMVRLNHLFRPWQQTCWLFDEYNK